MVLQSTRRHFAWMPLLLPLLVAGCAPLISVKRVGPEVVQRELTRNVLTANQPSNATANVLRRWDLAAQFDEVPAAALAAMHDAVVHKGAGLPELFALTELSFLHARDTGERAHYFATAVYAYTFLFGETDEKLSPIDPRVRVACDLYNQAIAEALRTPDGRYVDVRGGTYPLPFGTLALRFDPSDLRWGQRQMMGFVPASEVQVEGFRNRYRQAGLGAPLSAGTVPLDPAAPEADFVGPKVRVPTTAVIRFENPREQLATGHVTALLELLADTETETVAIQSHTVPLEVERTAALAEGLAESRVWDSEFYALLGMASIGGDAGRLIAMEPYRPGRIPVVFVHGTGSSPVRWADMVNDLQADPRIRHRYQFWFFAYDSGNPIAYSSLLLRRALVRRVGELDPQGHDACLRQMVVIGHSQGGLLTKMTAIDSGTKLWDNVSSRPFDEVNLSEKTRALVREGLFIKPLPFVTRVVFIATPHRGSFLAAGDFVLMLARWLIRSPVTLLQVSTDMVGLTSEANSALSANRLPTSIDNMSPLNPFIKTSATIPIAPGIAANSIIAVEGDGPIESEDDGVVKYTSAHLDGVESEFIVHSSHSTQSNPHTVEEVRRILLLHDAQGTCVAGPDNQRAVETK